MRVVKLSLRDSARLVIEEVIIFWQKARIPNREVRHCIPKLEAMYNEWRNLQRNASRRIDTQIKKENIFIDKF
jgi:adenylate/nucleoside-diphosphate kinase